MIARSLERGSEGEVVFVGESIVVGDDVSGLKIEVSAKFRELSAVETEKAPDVWGSVQIETDEGIIIGEVVHVGWAQNGGVTVQELVEVVPNFQWRAGRMIFQQYPRQ